MPSELEIARSVERVGIPATAAALRVNQKTLRQWWVKRLVYGKQGNPPRKSFEEWKAAVNTQVERLAGLSADDLPDAPYADWWEGGVSPASAAKRAIRAAGGENPGDLFDSIRVGDRVTIVNRFGQERTGRATIPNREVGVWVLNMGGPHGTPGIATRDTVVRVTGAKRRNPGAYRHKRLRRPSRFVSGSLRLTKRRKGVRVVVGKLKGERRRVKRGKRRGRPVVTAQAILTAKRKGRKGNPVAYSERKAWAAVRTIARRLRPTRDDDRTDVAALGVLADYMLEQLGKGVHVNPALAIFGANPPRRAGILSNEVQAVLYRHAGNGRDYVHPFGKGVRVVNKRDGSSLIRAAASARSGVRATLLSDGSVLLRHPTKPLWGDL